MSGFRRSLMKQAGGRLPAGLQEVEYLESADGNQYLLINPPNIFGYPNNAYMGDTRVYIEFSSPGELEAPLFGCRKTFNSWAFYIALDATGHRYQKGTLFYNYGTQYKDPMPNIGVDFSLKTALEFNQNHITINGTSYDSYYNYSKQEFMVATDFGLFCSKQDSTLYKAIAGTKIYCCTIDNELSNDHCNLIPCYTTDASWRNELGYLVPVGTKGMYDLNNNILYTNRGTNDFIAGPNV